MHVSADMWTHIAIQSCLLAWRWSHAWNLTPWIAASENISQLHNTNNFICGWCLSTMLMPWMYRYLTNDIKVTQEIFLWFLKKSVILTKDNLPKRNWQGSKYCCFYTNFETIQHMFFECNYAKFLWRALHMVFGITPPRTVATFLGIGISSVEKIQACYY